MAQRVAKARVAMDLKLSILSALNKLADRDTQQIAMDELMRIAENIQPDGIPVFLVCLYEISPDQKSVVRREGVKLLGVLAALYGDSLTPHLQKIVSAIVRRLKEPDSNIRDACVDTMGTLVAHVQAPPSLANFNGGGNADQVAFSGPVGVFTKPLFDTLNEQTRSVQIGAAMCLARALDNARDLPPACTQRLCMRILKFLNSPNFNAKPALLPALGGLSRASGGAVNQHLGIIISCLQESLQSSDWATRKAAADTFCAVALSVGGPPLTSFKSSTMALLDSYRFDKVKPARESVVDAIHIWKNVPDPPAVEASSTATVSAKSNNDSNGTLKTPSNRKYLTANSRSCSPTVSGNSVTSHAAVDKGSVKKKSSAQSAIPERKTNLDFFRKLSIRNSDDWQIEVAVPRGSPPTSHNKENHEETVTVQPVEKVVANGKAPSGNNSVSEAHEDRERPAFKALVDKFEAEVKIKEESNGGRSVKHGPYNWSQQHQHQQQQPAPPPQTPQQHQLHQTKPVENGDVNGHDEKQRRSVPGADMLSIGKQLSQLEKGQSELMEMLQDFMGNSQENTLSLEARVQRLERALEDMAASIGVSRSAYYAEEGNEPDRSMKPSESNLHDMRQFSGRSYNRQNGGEAETWNDNAAMFRANHHALEQTRRWDSNRFVSRLGEGPSARSVWRASKDEATLAAIRVAGDHVAAGPVFETDKRPSSARSSEVASFKTTSEQMVNGGAWHVWGRVMSSLNSGDLDSAYEEVICNGDELLLVRLMNRTGPVLDQLSSDSVGELLRSIAQFLQQPSFVDSALPWIRQVTEMVRTNGPKCLGISGEVKKELLTSLQEASMLDFPETWMASAVNKMASQLGNSWAMDCSIRKLE